MLVAALAHRMFTPIAYTWSPRDRQGFGAGAEAGLPMKVVSDPTKVTSYQGRSVTLTDAIGQTATANLAVSGEITIGRIIYPRPGVIGRGPQPPRGALVP